MSRRRAVLSEPSTICMCARTLRWLRPSSKRPHRLVPEEQAPPQSTALASAQHLPQEFRKEKKPLTLPKIGRDASEDRRTMPEFVQANAVAQDLVEPACDAASSWRFRSLRAGREEFAFRNQRHMGIAGQ